MICLFMVIYYVALLFLEKRPGWKDCLHSFFLFGVYSLLAGALAAQTVLPVIGIPVKSSTLDGLDALLSTVQMPTGIPVATVAIDGAANAALLAIQILAVSDMALAEKIRQARAAESQKVLEKNAGVEAKFN